MQIVRILLAAVIAIVAVVAGLFTAAFVALAALVAYVVLMIRGKTRAAHPPRAPGSARTHARRDSRPHGDVIDIEASEVQGGRQENAPRQP